VLLIRPNRYRSGWRTANSDGVFDAPYLVSFADGALIPRRFTCDDQDLSPPLAWADVPNNVRSFVVLCDDPDASGGTWRHWCVYDIPRRSFNAS
jgi:phosphatidylethanolamine-binding protein (PEBP) family uncharacterized protein